MTNFNKKDSDLFKKVIACMPSKIIITAKQYRNDKMHKMIVAQAINCAITTVKNKLNATNNKEVVNEQYFNGIMPSLKIYAENYLYFK